MAITPEGRVKAKLRALYAWHGAWYDRAAMNGMGRNGRPDDLVCRRPDGHHAGIEAKKEKVWIVSALQRVELNKIAAAGGSSMVVNLTNLEMVERWLQRPGTRLVAIFGDTERTQNRCTHHLAYVPGHAPVVVVNPGSKPGKAVAQSNT